MFAARTHTNTFVTVVRTYSSGSGLTETVPTGATSVIIEIWAGGGAGGRDAANVGGGGGGGSYSKKTISVIGGNTMTYSVAASVLGRSTDGLGNTGNQSTVTGTVAGGSVNMTALGGSGGDILTTAGSGGSASGGDINTSGGNGSLATGGTGAGPGGGIGGGTGSAGNPLGGGGGGVLSGTSGAGARGQVQFTYN